MDAFCKVTKSDTKKCTIVNLHCIKSVDEADKGCTIVFSDGTSQEIDEDFASMLSWFDRYNRIITK